MTAPTTVAASAIADRIDALAAAAEARVIAWRRDLHAHPELGNREVRTAGIVAALLRRLGLDEVRTGVAHTGVVALLKGRRAGPVVALRADMDALPVTEETDVPFASKVRTTWNGEEIGVMHACGHDCHTAILMGVAEILAGLRDELRGSVKFIFQPAEEMPPEGEEGGARLMIEQGCLQDPVPQAIFGLHVTSRQNAGWLGYRPGPAMASSDRFRITVHGSQTHGAAPWLGVDPIVTSAQVVLGLQTIVSRGVDIAREPAVVTVGVIKGGVRENSSACGRWRIWRAIFSRRGVDGSPGREPALVGRGCPGTCVASQRLATRGFPATLARASDTAGLPRPLAFDVDALGHLRKAEARVVSETSGVKRVRHARQLRSGFGPASPETSGWSLNLPRSPGRPGRAPASDPRRLAT